MGIYDAMKLCKADVSTICLGLAASMGAFLLASGTKGKRYCMPNARVMIHQPLGTSGGKVSSSIYCIDRQFKLYFCDFPLCMFHVDIIGTCIMNAPQGCTSFH